MAQRRGLKVAPEWISDPKDSRYTPPKTVTLKEAVIRGNQTLFAAGEVINADAAKRLGVTDDGFDKGDTRLTVVMKDGALVHGDPLPEPIAIEETTANAVVDQPDQSTDSGNVDSKATDA